MELLLYGDDRGTVRVFWAGKFVWVVRARGITHVGGDTYDCVPQGDDQGSKMPKNCYNTLPDDGKVILTEVKNDTVCNEKASNVFRKEREQYFEIQDLKAKLQDKNIAISELKKLIEKGKGKYVDTNFDRPSIVRQPNAQRIPKPSVLGKPTPFSNSLDRIYFQKTTSVSKANVSEGLSKPVTAQTLPQTAKKAVSNTNVLKPGMYRIDNRTAHTRAPQLPQTVRNTNLHVSTSTGVNHKSTVSRPQLKSNQSRDKVLPNNSQVKIVQLILFIVDSGCTKHMTGNLKLLKSTCFVRDLQGNDLLTGNQGSDLYTISLQESTSSTPLCLMAKATPTQPWLWHQRLSHLNFDYINLLLKKDIVIGLPKLKYVKDQLCSSCELSKAKRSSFKSKAVPSSKGRLNLLHIDIYGLMRVANINGKKYILVIVDDYSRYTLTLFLHSKDETPEVLKEFLTMIQRNLQALVIIVRTDRGTEDGENLDKIKEKEDQCILVGYSTQSKGYRVYNKRTRMIFKSIHIRFDEIKEVSETSVANNTSGLVPQRQKASDYDNPDPSTSAPSTHTNVHAEENNNDQAEEGEQLPDDDFTNPFCTPTQDVAESPSHNIGNLNVPTFNQPQVSEYQWTKDHPLEQVHGNPSRPVQTRRQLATDPEMYMYALTVSTAEPKNIKEAMADSAWIEAMQEELHQFDRLRVWELVDKPFGKSVIRLKWLWKNKKDEDQTVIRNKA
nr:retrotransposon protein, putative, Ty1-copia subclass [Tanacetum cinerariifolium]